jgi:intracellular sulfur oxidation DsrE/DsrF family protein
MAAAVIAAALTGTGPVLLRAVTAAALAAKAPAARAHRLAIQVNTEDPTAMRHAISNALNAAKAFKDVNEPLSVEIVTYGPGIHMFRADTSPVKDLLPFLRANLPDVAFIVCGNSKAIMEQKEGHPLTLVEGAQVVPAGVVRLVELQEAGWSYIRP